MSGAGKKRKVPKTEEEAARLPELSESESGSDSGVLRFFVSCFVVYTLGESL